MFLEGGGSFFLFFFTHEVFIVFIGALTIHAPLASSKVTFSTTFWVLAMITPFTEGTITGTMLVPQWSPVLQKVCKEHSNIMLPTQSTVVWLVPDIPRDELGKVFHFAVGNNGVLEDASVVELLNSVCLPVDNFMLPFTINFLPDNLLGIA
jgi:hypothetical protein